MSTTGTLHWMARLATSPPSVSDFDVHTVSKTYADHVHHCLEMVVQRLIFELNQTDEANTTPLGIMAFDAAAVADITIVLGGTGSASGQIRTIPDATSPIGTSTASQTGPSNPSSTPSSTGRTPKENGAAFASFLGATLVNLGPDLFDKGPLKGPCNCQW
jgi:hypothetical protein